MLGTFHRVQIKSTLHKKVTIAVTKNVSLSQLHNYCGFCSQIPCNDVIINFVITVIVHYNYVHACMYVCMYVSAV